METVSHGGNKGRPRILLRQLFFVMKMVLFGEVSLEQQMWRFESEAVQLESCFIRLNQVILAS